MLPIEIVGKIWYNILKLNLKDTKDVSKCKLFASF